MIAASATSILELSLRTTKRLARDWFLVGMIVAVALAAAAPDLGRRGGILHADQLADGGIAAVFFLHGLGISLHSLRDGLVRWRVHVAVQLFTFAVFPLLGLLLDASIGRWLPAGLSLGFFYLCALPSTISSSVAMTGIAGGNVPAAIFNATLSSLLGIVLTPALLAVVAGGSGGGLSLSAAVAGIAKLLLLPLLAGQILRPVLHRWHSRNRRYTGLVDRWVILFLVYGAFCDSVASGLWRDNGIGVLVAALGGSAVILAIVLGLSTWTARRLGFPDEDEIATVFCGSKKTLASGVPMAKLLFGANPALGLIVLPIMCYHQLQLFVCSVLANRYARRLAPADAATGKAPRAP